MPAVEVGRIENYRAAIQSGLIKGAILDPLPKVQRQEGPNCGFYALSIVMHYWKETGRKNAEALPARKRDVGASGTATPSLRSIGKQAGALDMQGVPKASTGGVFTAKQLAAVAKAVNYDVRVLTHRDPTEFTDTLCRLVDRGFAPIVAFDVENGDPVRAGGAHSHWGVIVGHLTAGGTRWLLATHGHGKYYKWVARDLQQSNFNLCGTTRNMPSEVKIRIGLKDPWKNDPAFATQQRPGWVDAKTLKGVMALAADPNSKVKEVELKSREIRRGMDVAQDLGCHIVCVYPK